MSIKQGSEGVLITKGGIFKPRKRLYRNGCPAYTRGGPKKKGAGDWEKKGGGLGVYYAAPARDLGGGSGGNTGEAGKFKQEALNKILESTEKTEGPSGLVNRSAVCK